MDRDSRLSERVKNWEALTGRSWPEECRDYANLAAKFGIERRIYAADDPLYGILKRANESMKLYPQDFEIADLLGVADFRQKLHEFQALKQRIAAWEGATDLAWDDSKVTFRELASKYHVPVPNSFPDDPIFEVLMKLDRGFALLQSEIQLLADRGAPHLADPLHKIRVAETEFRVTQNPRILAKISRFWRQIGRPEQALQSTGRVIDGQHRPLIPMSSDTEAMLLTTRGGAFRDLLALDAARTCAELSLMLRADRGFAYCLLGAIDLQEGNHVEAERNFSVCEELEPTLDGDVERRNALAHAKFPAEYAAYLLEKDRNRFAWAAKFLRR